MKLTNNALQELYDALVSGNPTISPYADSPFDKAFRECDDVLKVLQDRIDILEKSYNAVLSANLDLVTRKGHLENEFRKLKEHVLEDHKIIANINSERDALAKERDDLLSRAHCAEDEVEELKEKNALLDAQLKDLEQRYDTAMLTYRIVNERLDKSIADRKELQGNLDYYMKIYAEVQKDYDELFEESKKPNEKILELKQQLDETNGVLKKANAECFELRRKLSSLDAKDKVRVERIDEITKDRDFFFKQYHALKDDYEKLEAKYRDLKRYSNHYAEGYSDGKEEGEENLWDILQTVRDAQPEEFDPECETLSDILDMDLEDFLDAYKKWQEVKETDRMRDYLERFCMGRLCYNCPLHTDEFMCGRALWFPGIPDEDIKRYYEKARGCGRYTLNDGKLFIHDLSHPMESINRGITKACEDFCKAVRDADIKIIENLRKGCTFEATVNVDRDLLAKVCGIAPEEEEHKLEYGDAVRLPWCDYDYMYIEPDNEEGTVVRMFDPKNHAIATTHIGNVRYSGCKIIICDEDDLRKIWNHKK